MEQDFLFDLYLDIKNAKEDSLGAHMNSFPNFLSTLSDQRLKFYSTTVEKLIDGKKYNPSVDDIQKVVTIYLFMISEIEGKAKEGKVLIDADGNWVTLLFMFITMERFFRDGLIAEYFGFLHDESIGFKPSKDMKKHASEIMKNLSEEERAFYTKKFGL
jgi:hypothetical protein